MADGIEESGFRDIRIVMDKGHGVFADFKEPIRVAYPFNVNFVSKVKFSDEVFSLFQFVKYDAVVYFFNVNFFTIFNII